jgi:hypothetical protein
MRIIPKNLAIDNNSLAICTGNSLIENTDNIKFLGVMIEFKLTWKGHVSMSCERIIKTCFMIKCLWTNVSIRMLLMVYSYHALVQAELSYGILFLGIKL